MHRYHPDPAVNALLSASVVTICYNHRYDVMHEPGEQISATDLHCVDCMFSPGLLVNPPADQALYEREDGLGELHPRPGIISMIYYDRGERISFGIGDLHPLTGEVV